VPHNPLYTEPEIAQQLTDAKVEVAVTLSLMYPRVAPASRGTAVRTIVYTGIQEYMPPLLRLLYPLKARREGQWVAVRRTPGVRPFSEVLRNRAPAPVDVSREEPAVYLYTGGTTGVPKAVVLTHRNLICNMIQSAAWHASFQPGRERSMGVLPFFHSYGMTAVMNFSLWTGIPIVLVPRFERKMVLEAIARYEPTLFHGVPTMYGALLAHQALKKDDLRSIRVCISGAMGLPQEVQRNWEAASGGTLVEGYGLTEASPITHCNPLRGSRRSGSIGLPYPDTEAGIVNPETGVPLPPGEIGELVVRGPQVMRGYLEDPEETARALREGWLFTGDMARMDADGFFYIVDRRKEMINVGGLKVFPREVEEVIYTHPAIREACAAGVPDPLKGEVVKVFLTVKEGKTASPDEIIAFCRDRLAPHKVPTAVEFRDTLPKSVIGKILRRMLVEGEKPRAS
jgi:long-chain acyl-CoA synthetase